MPQLPHLPRAHQCFPNSTHVLPGVSQLYMRCCSLCACSYHDSWPPPEIFSSTTAETVPSVGHNKCSIKVCCKEEVIKGRLDRASTFLPSCPSPLSQHRSLSAPRCTPPGHHHEPLHQEHCCFVEGGETRCAPSARGCPRAEGIVFLPQAPQHLHPMPLPGSCATVLWLLVGTPAPRVRPLAPQREDLPGDARIASAPGPGQSKEAGRKQLLENGFMSK